MSHKRKGFALLKEYFTTTPYDECLIVAGRPIDGEYKNIQYVGFVNEMQEMYPENRGIYTQSDSPKKSSRNIWSLAVVSVDQRY